MSSSSKHTKEFASFDRLLSSLDDELLTKLDKDDPHHAHLAELDKYGSHHAHLEYYQGVMLHCEMSIPILGDLVNIIVDYLSFEQE